MLTKLTKTALNVMLLTVVTTSVAQAKVQLNSMCYMNQDAAGKDIQGKGPLDKKFELASISKIATSLDAINTLGADYRFKTTIYVTPVSNDSYDVHIEGSRHPEFGKAMGYLLISELNKKNIRKIENLTFDENFLIKWTVEDNKTAESTTVEYKTIEEQAESMRNTILDALVTAVNMEDYRELKARASNANVKIDFDPKPRISANHVTFVPKASFKANDKTVAYVLQSAPLRKILKKMNGQSNNYIADNLYWNLGGTAKFNKFISDRLALDKDDIVFMNGSGNNYNGLYNSASCETMIKVTYALKTDIEKQGYQLQDIMAVAQTDQDSTLKSFGGTMAKNLVGKTGTVNPAKTLTGMISTAKGDVFFTILMGTGGKADWGNAQQSIKKQIVTLIKDNGGGVPVPYHHVEALPFDGQSVLTSPMQVPDIALKAKTNLPVKLN